MPDIGTAVGGALSLLGGDDDGGAGDVADAEIALAREQAKLAREQYDDYKENIFPHVVLQYESVSRLLPDQEEAARTFLNSGVEDREFFIENYRPVERQFIQDATEGIQDRSDYLTGLARTDVDQSFDIQREISKRELERLGVNDPSSGNFRGLQRDFDIAQAGARAKTINDVRENERRRTEDEGFYRRGAVLNRGTGIQRPTQPTGVGVQGSYSAPGSVSSLYGNASSNYGNAANIYSGIASQNNAGIAGLSRTLGRSGVFSDIGTPSFLPSSGERSGGSLYQSVDDFFDSPAFEHGGHIGEGMESYGFVRGPGDGQSDSVNGRVIDEDGRVMDARFSNGEYVMPSDTVDLLGKDFFDELVDRFHGKVEPPQGAAIRRPALPHMPMR